MSNNKNTRLVGAWYQSWTPEGRLWCETSNKEEFLRMNSLYSGVGLELFVIPEYVVIGPKVKYEDFVKE